MAVCERTWLAAAIDGEGSISMKSQGRPTPTCYLEIDNTSKEFLEYAMKITGAGSIHIRAYLTNGGERKPYYRWAVTKAFDIESILIQIRPHLIVKRDRATFVLENPRNQETRLALKALNNA